MSLLAKPKLSNFHSNTESLAISVPVEQHLIWETIQAAVEEVSAAAVAAHTVLMLQQLFGHVQFSSLESRPILPNQKPVMY